MLERVLTWSLRHRVVVALLTLALALAGALAFRRLPLDAFPDTTPVQVQINTVAAALAPVEVERQITARVEQTLSGLPKLHEVRSTSRTRTGTPSCVATTMASRSSSRVTRPTP
ncbi:MAG TPA: efflux RND transporter permease subunit [Polyangiaceae bacterium]|nr:efflux RND transporter permease subunit [Polyangiaceae bacterium]